MESSVTYVAQKSPYLNKIKEKRKIKFYFYLYSFAFATTQVPYFSLIALQSTLHINENKGIISMIGIYGTSMLLVLLGTSWIVQKIGCYATLIISEIAVLIYVTGNFYPDKDYFFIPSSVFGGIMVGLVFTAVGAVNTQFAMAYSRFTSTSAKAIIASFQSQFFSIYMSSQIFGNVLSYTVLFVNRDVEETMPLTNVSRCGVEEGYPNTNSSSIATVSNDRIFIFKFLLPGCVLIGVLINLFIIPGCGRFSRRMTKLRNAWEIATRKHSVSFKRVDEQEPVSCALNNEGFYSDEENKNVVEPSVVLDSGTKLDLSEDTDVKDTEEKSAEAKVILDNNLPDEGKSLPSVSSNLEVSKYADPEIGCKKESVVSVASRFRLPEYADSEPEGQLRGFLSSATLSLNLAEYINQNCIQFCHANTECTTIASTMRFIFSVDSFLLFGTVLHYGMMRGFMYTELTRAFASCILGFHSVNLCVALHSVPEVLVAFCGGRIIKKCGIRISVTVAGILSFGAHLFCLLWIPTDHDHILVYALFFYYGICNGLWLPLSVVLMIRLHPDKQDIAMSIWNFLVLFGFFCVFATSAILPMKEKITMLMATLIFCFFTNGIYEILHKWRLLKA